MDRFLEYCARHPLLVAATVAMALFAVAYEIYRQRSAGAAVGPADAVRLLNQGAVVLDVRSRDQYDGGHIIDARHVESGSLAGSLDSLRKYKDKVLVVCCESGTTSGAAVRTLRGQGFAKVVNLRGGLQAWRAENLPLVRGTQGKASK